MIKFLVIAFFILLIAPPVYATGLLPIQTVKTASNIDVWYVTDKSIPLVSLSFAFKGGTVLDSADKQGRLKMLSTMLDEGAGNIEAKEFQEQLRNKSIFLSFQAGRDSFSGEIKYLKRYEADALTLLSLALTQPRFDQASLDRMIAANRAELNSQLNDPSWIAGRLLMNRTYHQHPYHYNVMGTLKTLQNISVQDLRDVHRQLFVRNNLVLAASGDVDQQSIEKIVSTVFAPLPEGAVYKPVPYDHVSKNMKPDYYALPIPQTAVAMAWPALKPLDKDWFGQVVLNHIFGGGGFSSKLMQSVRKDEGLTYGISSQVMALDSASRLLVETTVRSSGVQKALHLIEQASTQLQEKPVAVQDIQAAQDYLIGSQILAFSSSSKISNALLAWQLTGYSKQWPQQWVDGIKQVTPQDVQRVAQTLFSQPPVITLSGGDPKIPYTALKEIPNVSEPSAQ